VKLHTILLLLCQSVLVDSGVWTARISVAVNSMNVIRSSAVHRVLNIQGGQELTVMKISMNVWTHRTVVVTLPVKISMDQPFVTVIVGTAWWTTDVNVSIEIHFYHIACRKPNVAHLAVCFLSGLNLLFVAYLYCYYIFWVWWIGLPWLMLLKILYWDKISQFLGSGSWNVPWTNTVDGFDGNVATTYSPTFLELMLHS